MSLASVSESRISFQSEWGNSSPTPGHTGTGMRGSFQMSHSNPYCPTGVRWWVLGPPARPPARETPVWPQTLQPWEITAPGNYSPWDLHA